MWFPAPALGAAPGDNGAPGELTGLEGTDDARGVRREVLFVEIKDLQDAPTSTEDVWLRLHLLSSRQVVPHTISMEGVFGLLTNVVWTSAGPCAVKDFESTRGRLRAAGQHVTVYGVDKFPRMVDYVLPTGVRIADADRVRLGAHLAEGTTVMHEGFVNYNAGTLGASMVEGRISAGVLVGVGSDVGGGASIMGTLSGGGKTIISIGERCLLGANAGVGISLGNDCVVEAGCYVTAGTKVTILDMDGKPKVVKAPQLSGSTTSCSAATLSPAPSRRCRGRATSPSTPTCTPTDARTRWEDVGLLVVVGVVVLGVVVWASLSVRQGRPAAHEREVRGHGRWREVKLNIEQAENAALISAISVQRGMPARAATIALATAFQESKLYNIEAGDRDSLGIFQQRPSQGWGEPEQILNPYYATNNFYDELADVDGYTRCGSPRRRSWCSAPASPRRTPITRPTRGSSRPH